MSISGIGKSGVEEFVQTISQSVVTSELTATTADYTKNIQNEVLKDATAGALSVVAMSASSYVLRFEEQIIDKAFDVATPMIIALSAVPVKAFAGLKNKFGSRKGRLMKNMLGSVLGSAEVNVQRAQVVSSALSNKMQSRSNQHQAVKTQNSANGLHTNMIAKDKSVQDLSATIVKQANDSAMFKAMTGTFVTLDKPMIDRVNGAENVPDVEPYNQYGKSFNVVDSEGNSFGWASLLLNNMNSIGYQPISYSLNI